MKKWEFSIVIGLILAIMISTYGQFATACDSISSATLRLHILANSNEKQDQDVKLAVRDEILRQYGASFAINGDKAAATQAAQALLPNIIQSVNNVLTQNGFGYSATAYITKMKFGTTSYDGFTLPAGDYDAVRIELGNAKGKNWFCVLFPPLCLPASSDEVYSAYTDKENAVVHEKYKIKFAILEFFKK